MKLLLQVFYRTLDTDVAHWWVVVWLVGLVIASILFYLTLETTGWLVGVRPERGLSEDKHWKLFIIHC